MPQPSDVIVIGGGPAGAAVAGRLARAGASVVLLERSISTEDSGMGELIFPWGVEHLDRLGLTGVVTEGGAHRLPALCTYLGGDLLESTAWTDSGGRPAQALAIYYPNLKECLLAHAARCGTVVRRGVSVTGVSGGDDTSLVDVHTNGREGFRTHTARVAVVADGRHSHTLRGLGATYVDQRSWRHVASVRVAGLPLARDSLHVAFGGAGEKVLALPYGDGGGRVYLVCPADGASACRGPEGFDRLTERAQPVIADALRGIVQDGRVFIVAGRNVSTDWPRGGRTVTAVGDAAGSTDPSMGQGLATAFRDADTLTRLLLDHEVRAALREYERRRHGYFDLLRTWVSWSMRLWSEPGPAADALRYQVLQAREAQPDAGGWERVDEIGVDHLPVLSVESATAFFGGLPPPWAVEPTG